MLAGSGGDSVSVAGECDSGPGGEPWLLPPCCCGRRQGRGWVAGGPWAGDSSGGRSPWHVASVLLCWGSKWVEGGPRAEDGQQL